MLGFTINNGKEVTLAELADAGYTVQFLASGYVFGASASTSATGELDEGQLNTNDTFKYQVVISKDGVKVAESELKDVTVQDKVNLVTAISSVDLYVSQNTVDVKVSSGKLAAGDVAKIVVKGRTANMAADAEDADITSKVTLSTDKLAIATVAATGAVTQPGAVGTVTISAKAGDLTKAITVSAGNTARAISKNNSIITPASLSLATGDVGKIEVMAKDQYGDPFVLAANALVTAEVKNTDGATIAAGVTTGSVLGDATGKASVEVTADSTNAGTGNIVVTGAATELGKVALTVTAPGDVASYKLETSDKKYDIDLMDGTPSLQLALNGYDEGGLLAEAGMSLTDYSFESSNEDVATVSATGEVTGVAKGSAVIKIYKTADAFKTTVAQVTVSVKDSTPSITGATVADVDKVIAAGNLTLSDIFTEVTAVDPDGKAVDVDAFDDEDVTVTVDTTTTEIGKFLVTVVKPSGSTVAAASIASGKIAVSGEGTATINIALLNTEGQIVKDVDVEVDIPAPTPEPNNAPTVATGEATQTGSATPESTPTGSTPAVAYTDDMSTWFDDADGDSLTYSVVSATDADSGDVSGDVDITGSTITYTPAAAQASKAVTIVVKANDGTDNSTGNVTITVNVAAQPAD